MVSKSNADIQAVEELFPAWTSSAGDWTILAEWDAESGRLIELYLGQAKLSGEIPAELALLSNLRVLALDNNELTGTIPKELGRLSRLEHLYLHFNNLTGMIPKEFGYLGNLETLYV
ncbi:hypothetical protein HDU97_001977 [Phlyctochytrium planicorne]|nr:hypothetical protein HDU97_001977 [Phlyctochytrium planicorne]